MEKVVMDVHTESGTSGSGVQVRQGRIAGWDASFVVFLTDGEVARHALLESEIASARRSSFDITT